jgi:hypothetical protein
MKYLFLLILLFTFSNSILAQKGQTFDIEMLSSGSQSNICDTLIGSVKFIENPIPTYDFLLQKGYCYLLPKPEKTFTFCFDFTAQSNGVYLNFAFTSLGCNNVSFSQLTLCDKTDDYTVGDGQFFANLVIGHQYSWCVTGSASGGFFCQGISSICPYWVESTQLPVELSSFEATPTYGGVITKWVTMSETNSDYFILEKSKDLVTFAYLTKIKTSVYSTTKKEYKYFDKFPFDGISYYRLTQVDLNGSFKIYEPIYVNTIQKKPVKIFDIMGNIVDVNYGGLKILIFEDGSVLKYY